MAYTFIEDPGHGWLRVPVWELHELGIANKVSHCSYIDGEDALLEEDCDAVLFIEARAAAHRPLDMKTDIIRVYDESGRIRNCSRFPSVSRL